jgi:hypothetical protein
LPKNSHVALSLQLKKITATITENLATKNVNNAIDKIVITSKSLEPPSQSSRNHIAKAV